MSTANHGFGLIDRSYPLWTLLVALGVGLAAASAPHIINWLVINGIFNDYTLLGWLYLALNVAIYIAIAATLVLTRHLSALHAAIFVIAVLGGNLLLSALLTAEWFPQEFASRLVAVWFAPTIILLAAAATLGAFAQPRSLTRFVALLVVRLALIGLFFWASTTLLSPELPYEQSGPLELLGAIQPFVTEFLLVLVCLELFAPCRAERAAN
jgi:hypothetical protein